MAGRFSSQPLSTCSKRFYTGWTAKEKRRRFTKRRKQLKPRASPNRAALPPDTPLCQNTSVWRSSRSRQGRQKPGNTTVGSLVNATLYLFALCLRWMRVVLGCGLWGRGGLWTVRLGLFCLSSGYTFMSTAGARCRGMRTVV